MRKTLRYASAVWIFGATGLTAFGWTGCFSDSGTGSNSSTKSSTAANSATGSSSKSSSSSASGPSDGGDAAVSYTYTLIDDMETTTHGPIEFAGVMPPETPAYWFNFGGTACGDVMTPAFTEFTFTALPGQTTTLDGAVSKHAAEQSCTLFGQYDVCGVGFEFAQLPLTDGGDGGSGCETVPSMCGSTSTGSNDAAADAGDASGKGDAAEADAMTAADGALSDAGDGGLRSTVPFDISQYKGITFWGMAPGFDDAGGLDVKVLFPNTDTDPRGGVCNDPTNPKTGASSTCDYSQCYNSYAEHVTFTGQWQQFTVLFSDLAIDSSFGFQYPAPWSGTNVYGIEWQGQDNNMPDSGAYPMTIWVDDVYFVK